MFIPSSFSSFWDLIFPFPCGVDELDGGYSSSSCESLLPSVTWHLGLHTDKKRSKKIKTHYIRILSLASDRSIDLSKCKKEHLAYVTYEFSH